MTTNDVGFYLPYLLPYCTDTVCDEGNGRTRGGVCQQRVIELGRDSRPMTSYLYFVLQYGVSMKAVALDLPVTRQCVPWCIDFAKPSLFQSSTIPSLAR